MATHTPIRERLNLNRNCTVENNVILATRCKTKFVFQ